MSDPKHLVRLLGHVYDTRFSRALRNRSYDELYAALVKLTSERDAARNAVVLDGTLDRIFQAVLNSSSPDETRALLVELAHASADVATS